MTTEDFLDYVQVLSTQIAVEPAVQPILDANLTVQYLLPAVLREAVRRTVKTSPYLHSLVKSHTITITNGYGTLPAGVEEEFIRSFQLAVLNTYARSVQFVNKEGGSNSITADAGFGNFIALTDVGQKIVIKVNGVVVVSAYIEEVVTTNSITIRDYIVGSAATIVAVGTGTAQIFTPQRYLVRTIGSVTKLIGTNVSADVAGTGNFTNDDIGRYAILTQGATVIKTIIKSISDNENIVIAGYSGIPVTAAQMQIYRRAGQEDASSLTGSFSHMTQFADYLSETDLLFPIFHVRDGKLFVNQTNGVSDGTEIVLHGITIPQVPASSTTAIAAPETLLDTALLIAASVLRGEISLQSLGVEEMTVAA